MDKITLPSTRELKITIASFAEGRALYQAVLKELKSLKISEEDEIDVNLFKDIFCAALASKEIEHALAPCLKRCLIGDDRIQNDDLFEHVDHRQDYIVVCFEVAKANIDPFAKSLLSQYGPLLAQLQKGQK